MRVKLALFVRTTLEAVVTLGPCKSRDLGPINVGYAYNSMCNSIWQLRKLRLIEKRCGLWWPTERGKITLAIIMGQETRARGERAERKMVEQRLAHIVAMNRRVEKWRKLAERVERVE